MPTIGIAALGLSELSTECQVLAGRPSATIPFLLQCRACGFEPAQVVVAPLRCAKCAGSSWERVIIPGSLLRRADELAGPSARRRTSYAARLSDSDNTGRDVHGRDVI
jgi:hypothetical protein